MSQTAVFLKLSNSKYEYIFVDELCSSPDREDIEAVAIDNELYGEIEAEWEWYEIGIGESGTDRFLTDIELLNAYKNKNDFQEVISKMGYECDLIQSGSIMVEIESEEEY